jgi:uncharacterized Zn-finger protein
MSLPTVAHRVVANGRCGEVLLHDATDMDLTYKIKFDDGTSDWFKQSEVMAESAAAGVIKFGKQDLRQVDSSCSTLPSVGYSSASSDKSLDTTSEVSDAADLGDSTIVKADVMRSGNFQCPHCSGQFETEKAMHLSCRDKCMKMPTEVSDGCKSGDGSILSVGVKLSGKIQCPDCSQKFDTEKALNLHCKFIHDAASSINVGYVLEYEFNGARKVGA